MTRLRQIKPKLATLKPGVRMAAAPKGGAWSRTEEGGEFYKTARWQRLRWRVLLRDAFTCQWQGCGRVFADTSQLVADHIVPVRVDPSRIWDEANLQCLCKACHDGHKQAQDVARYGRP